MALNLTLVNADGESFTTGHAINISQLNNEITAIWAINEAPNNEHPFTMAVIHEDSKILKALKIEETYFPESNTDLEISWSL